MTRRSAFALLFAVLTTRMAGAADDAGELRTIVDPVLRPLLVQYDIPGMAVGILVNGTPEVLPYGVSSPGGESPVTEATLFEIGSISKMFTATLAAHAAATGQLDLDEHPGHYLPLLKGRPIDRATLLHLGTYTAGGLPLQFPDEVVSDEEALAYLRDWQPDAEPGTVRQYSNPSIGLLGAVTAAALGEGFAEAIETTLWKPLGMHHTFLHVPAEALADYAWGSREGMPVRANPGPLADPTYGVKTTASDLLRFVQANIDPSALSAPLRRAIEGTQVGRFRVGGMVQGFGWEQFDDPVSRETLLGGNSPEVIFEPQPVQAVPEAVPPAASEARTAARLFDKTGSTGGFGAYVAFVPARRIGVVLLANGNWPISARIEAAHEILERLPGPR